MSRRARTGAIVAILALLGLIGWWMFTRDGPGGSPPRATPVVTAPTPAMTPPPSTPAAGPTTGGSALPPIRIEESRISGADPSGRVQWELRAVTLQIDADQEEVRLTGVEGTFLERGRPAVTFTAPTAVFQMRSRDITLSGGVRARAGSDRLVEARQVRYLSSRRMLIATGGVRLTQEKMVVRADRLESDVALRRTRLTGNITVTIRE